MARHAVVTHDEWVSARNTLLEREKAFTRERDALSRLRRELPWEKVEKTYVFDGPDGEETLADLFAARSQLIVYTSCSIRIGTRAAGRVPSSPTTTSRPSCTWRNAT